MAPTPILTLKDHHYYIRDQLTDANRRKWRQQQLVRVGDDLSAAMLTAEGPFAMWIQDCITKAGCARDATYNQLVKWAKTVNLAAQDQVLCFLEVERVKVPDDSIFIPASDVPARSTVMKMFSQTCTNCIGNVTHMHEGEERRAGSRL